MSRLDSKQRWSLVVGGLLVTLLLAAVFTFGSLEVPFQPKSWRAMMPLFAVSCFMTAALIVFSLILGRTVLRLWAENSREQLGARFKTKMVVGAMAISLLPIIFMFIVSYSLINRTLLRWFPRPLEIASEESREIMKDIGRSQLPRLRQVALGVQEDGAQSAEVRLQRALARGADAEWVLDAQGDATEGGVVCENQDEGRLGQRCAQLGVLAKAAEVSGEVLPSGIEVWVAGGNNYIAARVPTVEEGRTVGYVVAGYLTSPDFLARI